MFYLFKSLLLTSDIYWLKDWTHNCRVTILNPASGTTQASEESIVMLEYNSFFFTCLNLRAERGILGLFKHICICMWGVVW